MALASMSTPTNHAILGTQSEFLIRKLEKNHHEQYDVRNVRLG
jgi:hypothetical protein